MDVFVTTDKARLDVEKIHDYISNHSYWGRGRSLEEVQTTIANSLCFGMYLPGDLQVGFGRVVTDYTIFAYLMDIFIFNEYQKKGYGKALVNKIMDHELLRKVRTIALKTRDAHGLYEAFGFEKIGNSPLWMTKDKVVLL